MTQDTTPAAPTTAGETRMLDQRLRQLEVAVLLFPVAVIEILLGLALLLPYVSDSVDGEETSIHLYDLAFAFLGTGGGGDIDSAGVAFVVAFLVLVAVIVGSMIALPIALRREVSPAADRTLLTFVVLLLAGTAGAWMVIGLYLRQNATLEPSLPVLSVAAVLAALIALVPAYRDIWRPQRR